MSWRYAAKIHRLDLEPQIGFNFKKDFFFLVVVVVCPPPNPTPLSLCFHFKLCCGSFPFVYVRNCYSAPLHSLQDSEYFPPPASLLNFLPFSSSICSTNPFISLGMGGGNVVVVFSAHLSDKFVSYTARSCVLVFLPALNIPSPYLCYVCATLFCVAQLRCSRWMNSPVFQAAANFCVINWMESRAFSRVSCEI